MEQQAEKLYGIVQKVQRETGYNFSLDEIAKVYAYTVRKCEVNGKGSEYVPILFENELTDYLTRLEINRMGEFNRCARFATAALV